MRTHRDLALLAQAAYDSDPTWHVDARIRACLTRWDDGTVVVATPGTDPRRIEDLWHDLDCDPVHVPGLGHVHDGFSKCFLPLYPLIKAELQKAGDVRRLIFTGHSLGGADAIGLAALWTRDQCGPCEFVTFGAPRVGTPRLTWLLRDTPGTMYRFGVDPVPSVPFKWIFHIPPVVYLHPKSLTHIGSPRLPLIVGNHLMNHYLAAVPDTPI